MRRYLFLFMLICSSSGYAKESLDSYINRIKQRTPAKLEPLPVFKLPEKHRYQLFKERNPFHKNVTSRFHPNLDRPKQPLENYALDALQVVGSLSRGEKIWALIAVPEGKVYPVKQGDYVGQNYGKIVDLNQQKIELIETIHTQSGWEERSVSLVLPVVQE